MPDTSRNSSSTEGTLIPQKLRKELIVCESQIMELQDRILEKDTEKADAVNLLGQTELLLEQKISYILELDRKLNLRVLELEQECDRKSEEIDRRGAAIRSLEDKSETDLSERDVIISDLNSRLETANQQIAEAHALARDHDLKRAEFCDKLESKSNELDDANTSLDKSQVALENMASSQRDLQSELTESRSDLEDATHQIAKFAQDIAVRDEKLDETANHLQEQQKELAAIKDSLLWKLGKPWRAVFGPKS